VLGCATNPRPGKAIARGRWRATGRGRSADSPDGLGFLGGRGDDRSRSRIAEKLAIGQLQLDRAAQGFGSGRFQIGGVPLREIEPLVSGCRAQTPPHAVAAGPSEPGSTRGLLLTFDSERADADWHKPHRPFRPRPSPRPMSRFVEAKLAFHRRGRFGHRGDRPSRREGDHPPSRPWSVISAQRIPC